MPKTILLVEDDFLNRRITKNILLNFSYEVFESKNTDEAHAILKTEKIDLIILDINLGEDKQEGICLARQINDLYGIPFIYLTAYGNIPTFNEASTTKPHSYLTKPFKEIDLIACIKITLNQTTLSSEKLISFIGVRYEDHYVDLDLEAIDYFESKGNYVLCYSGDKVYRYRSTIKQILSLPSKVRFIQIHRAYLINSNRIEKYNSQIVFVGKKAITVSRNYKKNLFEK